MHQDKPKKPLDPRRVLRPGTDPDKPEMPVAQRILDFAVRVRDRFRIRESDPLEAYAVPRPVADMVPGAWLSSTEAVWISRSGQRLTPDVAVFHDASGDPRIEARCNESSVALSVGAFDGGYLSLAIDLSAPICGGLAPGDTLVLTCGIDAAGKDDLPVGGLVRLNLDPGGAPVQMEQKIDLTRDLIQSVFVLSEIGGTIPRVGAAWVDLVFTGVANSSINLRNCCVSRKPEVPL